jgi:hypothetical protein
MAPAAPTILPARPDEFETTFICAGGSVGAGVPGAPIGNESGRGPPGTPGGATGAAGTALMPTAGLGAIGLVVARSHADPPVTGSVDSGGVAGASASGRDHGAGGAAGGSINAVGAGAAGVGAATADSASGVLV